MTKPQPQHDGRIRRLKVFGERNTGTRAAIQMLRALDGVTLATPNSNAPDIDKLEAQVLARLTGFHKQLFKDALLDARQSRLPALSAWKHAAPQIDYSYAEKAVSVLFIVRDPYSWIAALYRNPYHIRTQKPDTIEAFLQDPWLCMARDSVAPVLASPVQLWSAKLAAYQCFAVAKPVPSTVLHFEDFVRDPVKALGNALKVFHIPAGGLTEQHSPTKQGGLDKKARIAYYEGEAWKRELSPEAVRLVNSHIDWDLAAEFGYRRREPDEFGQPA